MSNIANDFGTLYRPVKSLVVYEKQGQDYGNRSVYVESYDMDMDGCPINGHPLTIKEGNALAKALTVSEKKRGHFLNPKGLMPKNLLYLKSGNDGFAVWQTPPQRIKLLFTDSLSIPSGIASIPAMVWKATKNSLQVFAVTEEDLTEQTPLCHAPFFNIYSDGKVCMGNVQVAVPQDCGLEQFIALWQNYFFNSYFSHLFHGHVPVKGNIIQLWKNMIGTKKKFPAKVLKNNQFTIKHLLP